MVQSLQHTLMLVPDALADSTDPYGSVMCLRKAAYRRADPGNGMELLTRSLQKSAHGFDPERSIVGLQQRLYPILAVSAWQFNLLQVVAIDDDQVGTASPDALVIVDCDRRDRERRAEQSIVNTFEA